MLLLLHGSAADEALSWTELAAEEWLTRIRWRKGFRCPRCAHQSATRLVARRTWQCHSCRHQTSVTAGTALHGTRLPLATIVYAIWMVGARKQSISALQLQKDCRIGSYQAAWLLLHRIRRFLTEGGRPLRGPCVEVHEPLIDHGDGVRASFATSRCSAVAMAIERWRDAKGSWRACGRVRMVAHSDDLHVVTRFISDHLGDQEGTEARGLLARTLEANLRAWIAGTFHGVSDKYLFAYVREFVFRLNRRRAQRALPLIVARSLLDGRPLTVRAIVAPDREECPLAA